MRSIRVLSALMLGGLALGAPAAVVQSAATTFTVTKTADTNDGVCDADCSLREAITAANANAGTDTIAFDIPGGGPHTIAPTSALPTITDPVIIDGYTQSGASENTNGPGLGLNTVLKIELDGTSAGAFVSGLVIAAGTSTVRGLAINRFPETGIVLVTGSDKASIEGNFIGTDVAGSVDLGNTTGIIVATPDNKIGGTDPSERNLISGNGAGAVGHGVVLLGSAATGNLVQGNLIGVNAAGLAALGNERNGVVMNDAPDNTVGGLTAVTGNVISGNTRTGVRIREAGATGNTVRGNFIGTDVGGTLDIGNVRYGVRIGEDADDNSLGGVPAGAGNVIAFNGLDGVSIKDASTTGDAILGNSIFSNVELGIDLGNDSAVEPNDAGDGDPGANNLQNFPVLTSAVTGGGFGVSVGGTLDSTANAVFRVEFFSNAACDPSGNGEGETFLGAGTATTDGSGTAVFAVGLTKAVLPGELITATATDPDNNTSEFSACITAVASPPVPGITWQGLAGLAALLAGAFAWMVRRRQRAVGA